METDCDTYPENRFYTVLDPFQYTGILLNIFKRDLDRAGVRFLRNIIFLDTVVFIPRLTIIIISGSVLLPLNQPMRIYTSHIWEFNRDAIAFHLAQ